MGGGGAIEGMGIQWVGEELERGGATVDGATVGGGGAIEECGTTAGGTGVIEGVGLQWVGEGLQCVGVHVIPPDGTSDRHR